MDKHDQDHITWFRHASPYINAHRHKVFVLMVSGKAIQHDNFINIIQDIALLQSLGVRLVLVHGSEPQIECELKKQAITTETCHVNAYQNLRVTTPETMQVIKQVVGANRIDIEALFSTGTQNSPLRGSDLKVCSGNFVIAKPYGVVEGRDLEYTGKVRKIATKAITQMLETHHIVLLSCIGYSPTGEAFNLCAYDVATQVAIGLQADKLITFNEQPGVLNDKNELIRWMTAKQAAEKLAHIPYNNEAYKPLLFAIQACQHKVRRCHIISYESSGALLQELFTRDGTGSMVTKDSYEAMRSACIEDVAGILNLLKPLEAKRVLVRRSRERLEREIDRFVVIERDGLIIGCAALYPFPEDQMAELACVAIHDDYRGSERGDSLLSAIENKAQTQGISALFVLTTQTAHWFRERDFEPATVNQLPSGRQQLYNFQRNSQVYIKRL